LHFPDDSTAYPHCRRYFHKEIGVTTSDLPADLEYLTNQRRRNLPVGESGQGPSGEPATGLAKHSENWLPMDGTRESSYIECDDRRVWESAGFARRYQTILKWQSVVIWTPNRIFEKSESRGRNLEREIALSLF
jgi:hypothetical protein